MIKGGSPRGRREERHERRFEEKGREECIVDSCDDDEWKKYKRKEGGIKGD